MHFYHVIYVKRCINVTVRYHLKILIKALKYMTMETGKVFFFSSTFCAVSRVTPFRNIKAGFHKHTGLTLHD